MDLHGFLRSRRSIRRFEADEISAEVIDRILTTATFAPSAHNRQPWRFAVLATDASKALLADAMSIEFRRDLGADGLSAADVDSRVEKSRARLNSAPVAIILCMDTSDMDIYPDSRRAEAERAMALQSTANAGLILLLAAHAEGLGAVWNCSPLFAPNAVGLALQLPRTWEPQALFFIGNPAGTPDAGARKPLREVSVRL